MDWKKLFAPVEKLRSGLSKTRSRLTSGIKAILTMHRRVDDDLIDELEEALITADVGVDTTARIIDDIRTAYRNKEIREVDQILDFLKADLKASLAEQDITIRMADKRPTVILVAGVNGSGKTTSIAKLANFFKGEGLKVLLAASDTFRAAAVEQLDIWRQRIGVDIVKHQTGADPAAVTYDALEAAIARDVDVLIVDTAGRLHTKQNLMNELGKIRRVIQKLVPEAPHEVLLVLDATTGQNAISQARLFNEAVSVTGLFLAKLDGTAKGGIIIAIRDELDIPVKFVGLGETLDDIAIFDADQFVEALFG